MLAEHRREAPRNAIQIAGVEVGLDLQKRAPLLERLLVDGGRQRDGFVDRPHRAFPIAARSASLRQSGQEMRHLQRRNVQFAGEHDRALGVLARRRAVAESLFEHGTKVMEIGPLHAAGRRQAAFHRFQA